MKYTRTGHIRVKLEAYTPADQRVVQDHEEQSSATIVKLTVTDTGQGMSPQFMRTKVKNRPIHNHLELESDSLFLALHTFQPRELHRPRDWSGSIVGKIHGHYVKWRHQYQVHS
jgi:hypothetical protein